MTCRLLLLCLAALLATGQTGGADALADRVRLDRCTAASGFTARAEAARAAGVAGEVLATRAERAAIATCVKARAIGGIVPADGTSMATTAAHASPPVPTRKVAVRRVPRQCNLEMVGGTGYRCSDRAIRR